MTVEPSAVRFHFGTSVRTWAKDEPPQPIIANVFRDVDESNHGLTAAVEESCGSLMRRMARNQGQRPPDGTGVSAMLPHKTNVAFEQLRRDRIATILHHLRYAPMTRVACLELLGMSDGPYWTRIMQTLRDDGLATFVRANNRTTITITDAGRKMAVAMEGR